MGRKRRRKNKVKKYIKNIAILIGLFFFIICAINIYIVKSTSKYIYTDVNEVPNGQVVIVLGAYVRENRLSPVLEDRVLKSMEIVQSNSVNNILLSGDHGRKNYDEVNSMKSYILKNSDIPKEDIFLDHAGFDTYDSMYRAREIFEVKKAIVVTQEFHIHRAVYIGRKLGIDVVGYAVNQDKYSRKLQFKWTVREFLARIKAFAEVNLGSQPKFLGEKIPITGDGTLSWDEEE